MAEAVRNHAPVQAITNLNPSVLDDLLADRAGSTRKPVELAAGVGPQMVRINSLGLLLRSIGSHLRSRSAGLSGAVSLECTDTGEAVALEVGDGEVRFDLAPDADKVALDARQMVQLIFGGHPSCEPLDLPAARRRPVGRAVSLLLPHLGARPLLAAGGPGNPFGPLNSCLRRVLGGRPEPWERSPEPWPGACRRHQTALVFHGPLSIQPLKLNRIPRLFRAWPGNT